MRKGKIHYADCDPANESNDFDEWSDILCGTDSEEVSNDWSSVTCKKCLKRKEQHDGEMKEAMDHSCKDMALFVEFIKMLDEAIKNQSS